MRGKRQGASLEADSNWECCPSWFAFAFVELEYYKLKCLMF